MKSVNKTGYISHLFFLLHKMQNMSLSGLCGFGISHLQNHTGACPVSAGIPLQGREDLLCEKDVLSEGADHNSKKV